MSTNCPPAPANKKEYITAIGKILVKKFGKKTYYSPEEVKKAHAKTKWSGDEGLPVWAMSAFSSKLEFDRYQRRTGQEFDYAEMKKEIFEGISMWQQLEILEPPKRKRQRKGNFHWLDFGEAFGQILVGILEFIGGLAEGL